MGCAVNKARTGVQKLVGLPFQRHATMRAAVEIDEYLPAASGGEKFLAVDFKPAALGFRQLIAGAEQFHRGLHGAGLCRQATEYFQPCSVAALFTLEDDQGLNRGGTYASALFDTRIDGAQCLPSATFVAEYTRLAEPAWA